MTDLDVPKFVSERQNVNTEGRSAEPLGYRASHVQFPATVPFVPLSGVRS